jgi:hypothetical protein
MVENLNVAKAKVGQSWLALGIAGIILAGVCAASYWFETKTGDLPQGGLTLEDRYLNLGEVWEDSKFPWKLPIRNQGTQKVEIIGFATSCSCVSLRPHAFVLGPGEGRDLELIVNLMRTGRAPGEDQGIFETFLVPHIKEGSVTQKGWVLRARVRRALTITPENVDFGGNLVQGQLFPPKKVDVWTHMNATGLFLKYDRTKIKVITRRSSEDNKFSLEITLAKSMPPGPFNITINVQPEEVGKKPLPGRLLLVQGIIQGDIQALPSAIRLGAQPVGETALETVTFKSASGQPLELRAFEADSKDLKIEPIPNQEFEGQNSFRIKALITQVGHHTNQVTFVFRRRDSTEKTKLVLPVQYYGLPATEKPGIAAIEKLGGKVKRDEAKPGRPVVWVELDDTKVKDRDLIHLKEMRQLTLLSLNNTNVTDQGMIRIKELKQLRNLRLDSTKISDAGLVHLKDLKHLRGLSLWNTKVTDAAMVHLKELKKLESLILSSTKITDKAMTHIKELTQLETLVVNFTDVTNEGLSHIKEMKELRNLGLHKTKVTDDGLAYVKELKKLNLLLLSGNQVTDAGLIHLKGLEKLSLLQLNDTPLSDAGLIHLQKLKELRLLEVKGTRITDAGIANLKEFLPGVQIQK